MTSPLNSRSSLTSSKTNRTKNQRAPLSLEQLETRMLMAFDVLDQQIGELSTSAPSVQSSPVVGSVAGRLQVVGTSFPITNGQRIVSSECSVQVQLTRDASGNLPAITWGVSSRDALATGYATISGDVATLTFNRPADYRVTAASGNRTLGFNVRITPSLTTLALNAGTTRLSQDPLTVAGRLTTLNAVGLDQLGRNIRLTAPLNWQVEEAPQGSSPQFALSGARTRITFDRAGAYTFRVTSGSASTTVRISVVQTLAGLSITPGTGSVARNATLQFIASGIDQFQQPMASQPAVQFAATGGTINSQGLFQAGNAAGNFRVTARSGSVQARANVTITSGANNGGQNSNGVSDANLRSLVTTFYADGTISREEMLQILRSTGTDNTVSSTELTDLRYIVSPTSNLRMPEFVRTLARNVVTSNPANLRYQGQVAGNLAAGSTSVLLNNLVDKWFLGTDLPAITGNGISYRFAVGSLFPTDPQLDDSKQGMLGDCYFLASLVSIGVNNPTAIRNMFIENNDGTVSVRFFANGVADYVTVNRSLPTYASGVLAYSGYGRSALSSSTQLWLALAEKAYAQWNETGKSGRDGTNRYAAIEGGWMGTVNAQVLGFTSSNFAVNSTNKQNLINAINTNQAVTIGTNPGATVGGLVGSHAYIVTGYNSTTDTFSFYNPWSFQHPTALNWDQMQGQTSFFVVTSPNGPSTNGSRVSGSVGEPAMGYVEILTTVSSITFSNSATEEYSSDPEELQLVVAAIEFSPAEFVAETAAEYTSNENENSVEETPNNLAGLLADISLMSLESLEA